MVIQLVEEDGLVDMSELQAGSDLQTLSSVGSAAGQLFPLILFIVLSISIYSDVSGKRISLFGREKKIDGRK